MRQTSILPLTVLAALSSTVPAGAEGSFILLEAVTVDGGDRLHDEMRGVAIGPDGLVYATGYVALTGHGRDIWLAIYDTDLVQLEEFKLNGPVDDTDKARFMAFDDQRHLFVSGSITENLDRDFDIWIGRYAIGMVFADGFEYAGPLQWSTTVP
jgi:hypothetical protein